MKTRTKCDSDWKKKEPGKLHNLGILKSTGVSGKPNSISTVIASDTIEERGYSGAAIYIAKAVEVLPQKGASASMNKSQSPHVSTPFKARLECKQVGVENEQ